MKYPKLFTIIILFAVSFQIALGQSNRDKGEMIEYKNPFWEKIKESSEEFEKKEEKKKLSFKMNFDDYDLPESTDEFTQVWHNEPISQGWTGTCWCFCTTSFFESEIKRVHDREVKLSEMFTVYWEYVEKAREYIRTRGQSRFSEGSLHNAVIRTWQNHGAAPASAYTGLQPKQEFHNHSKMYKEMMHYLKSVKEAGAWNEEVALETIKSIMNHYIGVPPESFSVNGQMMSPKEYLDKVVDLDLNNYIDVLSLYEHGYWNVVEHDVPDNWWNGANYHNVPLDVFMDAAKNAIKNGYSFAIGGDVSETGYNSHKEVAMVPSYDIPSDYIDEMARQFRYSNGTTSDDHGIHVVGYKEDDSGFWFLIKDSGSGSRNGDNEGYYFYHEDYIKLKMMNFIIHADAIKDIMKNFK